MSEHDDHLDTTSTGSTEPATDVHPPPPAGLSWTALIGVLLISGASATGYLLRPGSLPAGLAEAELQHGLLARQSSDFGLQWAIENAGPLSIPLVIVISWVGGITGYDAETPRIAAGIFGAGAILFTGLWLSRGMGPIWGLAGAAVLAGSFWQILYSRLATGQIAGAFAFATLCWLLPEAAARRGTRAMPWAVLAGVAAGIGFLASPSLRFLPLAILGILIVSLWRMRENPEESDVRNWLMATAASYLTVSPYLISHWDDPQLWTPWTATPGLPGHDPATLIEFPGALIDTTAALALSSDVERGMNLPADPWFSLLMLPWALIGLLGLISASNDPALRDRFLAGLAIGATAIIGIVARDAGHPGQLIVIGPALAGVTVYGFRTTLHWAQVGTVRYALTTLVIVGIVGQAMPSIETYTDRWAADPETEAAFHAHVIDALSAVDSLETSEPVFISLSGHGTALDYFRTPNRRHTFDGQEVLQFPADENGYLIETASNTLNPALAEVLDRSGSGTQTLGTFDAAVYRLDDRIREQMPLSVPTVAYPRGPAFHGSSDPSRVSSDRARVLLAWKSNPGSPAVEVETRLRTADTPRLETTASTVLPANPLQGRIFQVLVVEIEIPDRDSPVDLEIRLRREDGTINPVGGMDEDGYLLINRYVFGEQ